MAATIAGTWRLLAFLLAAVGLSAPLEARAEFVERRPDGAPPKAAAPEDALPTASGLTRRKCTSWSAGPTMVTREMAFHREHLVQKAQQETEVTYQMWDVNDALEASAADDACREKARSFCEKNGAVAGMCRFQVHEGLTNGGWDGAATVTAKKTVKPKKKAKPAKAAKPGPAKAAKPKRG